MRPLRRGDRASSLAPSGGGGVATLEAPEETSTRGARRKYDPAWDDWNPPRRWPGVLLSCVIVLAFLAVVVWHFRPHEAPSHSAGPRLPNNIVIQKTYVVGHGKDVTAAFAGLHDRSGATLGFTSNGGLLILHASCQCTYNFDVTIDQGFDNPIAIPITGVGHYDDASDITLPAGHYQFSVVGSGLWKLQLIQPQNNLPVLATPFVPSPGCGCHEFSYFSDGDGVIGPFSPTDDKLGLTFLSKGHGLIVTHVLDVQGSTLASPLIGKSPYEQSKTVPNLPDPYYLEITAVGFWDVQVKPSAGH
jgi:hypothetical protein